MGRYLANGVMTRFIVKKSSWYSNKDFDLKKESENIKNELNKTIDTNLYNMEEYDNCLYFLLKPEVFDNHIHELIK